MDTKIDLIFRGRFDKFNIDVIFELLKDSTDAYFNFPENINSHINPTRFVNVIIKSEYVDFVISSRKILISEKEINGVFINFGKDGNKVEILLFFDLKKINPTDYKWGILSLQVWAIEFKIRYNFDSVICLMDNGEIDSEYYFQDDKLGPLFDTI